MNGEQFPVEACGGYIKVTEEDLEDVVGVRQLINGELVRGIMVTLVSQTLAGSGSNNQLKGVNTRSGIQAEAVTTGGIAAKSSLPPSRRCSPRSRRTRTTAWPT